MFASHKFASLTVVAASRSFILQPPSIQKQQKNVKYMMKKTQKESTHNSTNFMRLSCSFPKSFTRDEQGSVENIFIILWLLFDVLREEGERTFMQTNELESCRWQTHWLGKGIDASEFFFCCFSFLKIYSVFVSCLLCALHFHFKQLSWIQNGGKSLPLRNHAQWKCDWNLIPFCVKREFERAANSPVFQWFQSN